MSLPEAVSDRVTIRNRSQLAGQGQEDLRSVALEIAEAGLRAADPRAAVERAVARSGDKITVADRAYTLSDYDRVLVLGAGKASLEVLRGLESVFGDVLSDGVVVVRRSQSTETGSCVEILEGDHPLPTAASVEGANRLVEIARTAGARDLILGCFTGGSSALACLPPAGVTLQEKRELHRLLLSSGAPINEINAVRKHVSAFKGGRLAATAPHSTFINLTVCDVVGCDHDLLTDPTVPDASTVAQAIAVLRKYRLWDEVATSIRRHLQTGQAAESPTLDQRIQTEVIVTARAASLAMAERAIELGRRAFPLGSVEGEARASGHDLARRIRQSLRGTGPFPRGSAVIACGGESTVSLAPGATRFGAGGPNQELVLGAALELKGEAAAILSIDTDGSDGGGRFAGGMADGQTAQRASDLGLDVEAMLEEHSSSEALRALGDLVDTGPTGTNVNDLVVMVFD